MVEPNPPPPAGSGMTEADWFRCGVHDIAIRCGFACYLCAEDKARSSGLSLRDELAAQVFVAMIPHHIPYTVTSGERVVERGGEPRLASMSYALADAFLTERNRQREAGGK